MARNSKKNKDKDKDRDRDRDKEKDNLTPILDEPTGPEFDDDDSSQDRDIIDAIEQAKNNGWNQDSRSFFERNRGTIFPFIIFLVIIFAGIGIISWLDNSDTDDSSQTPSETQEQGDDKQDQDKDDDSDKEPDTDATDQEQDDEGSDTDTDANATDQESPSTDRPPPVPVQPEPDEPDIGIGGSGEIDAAIGQYIEATQVGDAVMVSAQSGEGITHLARKSLVYWVERNGESLSDEQRVYAEDYIQNYTGTQWLDVGETLSFDNDLIEEAFNASQNLADWQITNLTQYT